MAELKMVLPSAAAVCGSVLMTTAGLAAKPAVQAAGAPPNGTWTVHGRGVSGTRECGDWLVRLTTSNGGLSGIVSARQGSVILQNMTLLSDGAFSGSTQAHWLGPRYVRAYRVTGRFSGNLVNLTFEHELCPARHGSAMRRATG